MSTSRPSSSPTEPATNDLDASDCAPSAQVSSTITADDGTVLATISRRTEHASLELAGRPNQPPLVVIDVDGDLDADTAPLLHTALTSAVRRNRHVCCDLNQVAFLSAAGVNTILDTLRHADDAGCVFTVRGVHGISARVFQITGLDALLAARA